MVMYVFPSIFKKRTANFRADTRSNKMDGCRAKNCKWIIGPGSTRILFQLGSWNYLSFEKRKNLKYSYILVKNKKYIIFHIFFY